MGKKTKQPRIEREPPASDKKPRIQENPDAFHDKHPVWRFSALDVGCANFGWNTIDGGTLHRIRERLAALEAMTFRDVLKTGTHVIPVYKICEYARKRLGESLPGIEELLSIRVGSEQRLWGFRTLQVVTLLWWDPDHQVYPVAPRNT